jgi:shikimate dehydrogenase
MKQGILTTARPISGGTAVVGVMGWPIEHSLSPAMHNAAFGALGLDWCYVPLAVPPAHIAEAARGILALGLRGVNVTVPHKQAMLALVDDLTPEARAIGAVNTVLVEGKRMLGHNTDARGFLRAVREAGFAPEGRPALVLGAGGAARAVVYALASVGAPVTICNRNVVRAERLADDMRAHFPGAELRGGPLDAAWLDQVAPQAALIVNATSVGMWPHTEPSPWPEGTPFPRQAWLYDLIYNPRETRLMRQARQAGLPTSDGLGMLVHQGAEAFRLWTGIEPPTDVMGAACEAALRGG